MFSTGLTRLGEHLMKRTGVALVAAASAAATMPNRLLQQNHVRSFQTFQTCRDGKDDAIAAMATGEGDATADFGFTTKKEEKEKMGALYDAHQHAQWFLLTLFCEELS